MIPLGFRTYLLFVTLIYFCAAYEKPSERQVITSFITSQHDLIAMKMSVYFQFGWIFERHHYQGWQTNRLNVFRQMYRENGYKGAPNVVQWALHTGPIMMPGCESTSTPSYVIPWGKKMTRSKNISAMAVNLICSANQYCHTNKPSSIANICEADNSAQTRNTTSIHCPCLFTVTFRLRWKFTTTCRFQIDEKDTIFS